ncbi:cytochrome P450 [Ornithinibacillus contaminans]|uniref:cytochrome P450 n=1 Tax=Ornithinibacillus contaminans TaxID=694055 RepID=UPI00064DE6A8|nr:cytochrome P450 [Ornithinibacillus contaminans]
MPYREQIPVDKGFDNTLKLLLEGYNFITNRRNRFGRDIFETRILGGKKAICIAGEDAVKIFYDREKFIRKGAAPKRIRQTLFGEHAIQTTDGDTHQYRKELFMSLMTKERLEDMNKIVKRHLDHTVDTWLDQKNVVVYDEMVQVLTKAACEWAGVPIAKDDIRKRANALQALFDGAGALGSRHFKGRVARNATEGWLKQIVQQVRDGQIEVPQYTALYQMCWFQDTNGTLLHEQLVAVELLNILRPIVAVAVYITFGALALSEHPEEKEKLLLGKDEYLHLFVEEVRRYYPFFPFLMAIVREDFLWNGHDFKKGNLVLLDIYGTNHHEKLWNQPYTFNPERFKGREDNFYDFIPQGGGDYYRGHRCPGEWLTLEVMKVSLDFLVNKINYDVPKQELHYSMNRIPSLPKSGFVIQNVTKVLAE